MVERILARKLPATGRKVAVAGAGPTGLTAAFYLAMLGHDVTVFEEHSEAGGMLRFAIPEYRLPKSVLRRELDLIEAAGVKMRFNTRVGVDLPLNDLAEQFDAVFICHRNLEGILALSCRNGTEERLSRRCQFLEAVARKDEIIAGLARRHHRRRQRGHRFGAHRAAHGRAAHYPLSPRAQGHARHRRGDPGRRRRRRALRLSRRAAPHHRRRQGQCEGHRDRQDAPGRVRQVGPPQADPHRRGAALRVRQRDSGRGRNLRPGLLPRLRPGD